jgi:hypothetical protein
MSSHLNNGDPLAEQGANETGDFLTWHFFGRPAIMMPRRVMEGIDAEATATAHVQSLQRLEVGGILLGHRDEQRVFIEDFEPVLCDHCFGPSYLLVGENRLAMEETLNWFRNDSPFSILGWYRSITRPDFSFENEAIDLLLPTPLEGGDVALLLFPHRPQPNRTQFLFKGAGELLEAALPLVEEPVSAERLESAAPEEPARVDPGPVESARFEAARADTLKKWVESLPSSGTIESEQREAAEASDPPPACKQHSSSSNRRPGWLWLASAVVFGAVLAYVSAREPKRSSPLPAPMAVPAEKQHSRDTGTNQPQEKGGVLSQPERPGEDSADRSQRANASQDSTDVQIRNFLENWAEAAKAGDIERAASMYAERVSTFFTKRNVTRADVHKERNLNLARYGRMSLYRISDIQISPISTNQVSVTFRKMWQSSGPRVTSGEEKEQLILERDASAWRIVSEKEIKVYWVKKPHLLARSAGN